ncbi:hypothetical protein ACXZFI_005057, partial [Escherichia coli]
PRQSVARVKVDKAPYTHPKAETRSVKTVGFLFPAHSRFATFTNMRRIISTTIRGTAAINPAQS